MYEFRIQNSYIQNGSVKKRTADYGDGGKHPVQAQTEMQNEKCFTINMCSI